MTRWIAGAALALCACGGSTEPEQPPVLVFGSSAYRVTLAETQAPVPASATLYLRNADGSPRSGAVDVQFSPAAGTCAGPVGFTVEQHFAPAEFYLTWKACHINSDNTYQTGLTTVTATYLWNGKPITATTGVTLR